MATQTTIGIAPTSKTKPRDQSFCTIFPVSMATLESATAETTSSGPKVSMVHSARPRKTRKARPMTSSRMSSRRWSQLISPVALNAALIHMIMTRARSHPESCLIEETTNALRKSVSPWWKLASAYCLRTQQMMAMRPSSAAQAGGVAHVTKANFQVITCWETSFRMGSGQSVNFSLPGQPLCTHGSQMARHRREAKAAPTHTALNHWAGSRLSKTRRRSG
mmetsp:Transcript_75717/g.195115  ORF Transcript_75717/g.195115 Transcript_75717/m.195115 type:complete len:221 (-) Transcript_75717:344-1006(-)